MKIIFEHQGRKTTIIGNDYDSIVEKIRSLFPNQNHHRIQFYDAELSDYFEFTSYEQVIGQPNGLKMNFDMSSISDSFVLDPSSSSTTNDNDSDSDTPNKNLTKRSSKRSRKKSLLSRDRENIEPPSLPQYCDLIIQGLQSRESFPAIQQEFLRQTCAVFLQQYPDSSSRKVHHSFVMALTQKFPALNFLNKSVDGVDGKAPYHTISRLLSRKKRNLKYSKTHPTPKRARTSTLDSSSDNKANTNVVNEETAIKDAHNLDMDLDKNNFSDGSSIEELIDESFKNQALNSLRDPFEEQTVTTPSPNTPIRSKTISKNDRQATISLVTLSPSRTQSISSTSSTQSISSTSLTQSGISIINLPSISTTPVIVKPIIITNTPSNLIYHNGRMHITSLPSQSIVAVHKAIVPRDCEKKQEKNQNDNCQGNRATNTKEPENILKQSTVHNVEESYSTKNNLEVLFPKLSNSEQSAYNTDVARLRSITKPKNKSSNNISIGELIMEFMLLQNQILTWDELQYKSRDLLDGLITKYKIETQEKTTEADFSCIKIFCEAAHENNLFFKIILITSAFEWPTI
ncbi:unnamed protein product [Rotaria sordida]|uniref:Uncharacterized protein n=1 Tax=Rotaria sordida TaxID=392033 RepID=A0A819X3S1_9BILA|nr:unnamed protein product [Rotaria sordida]